MGRIGGSTDTPGEPFLGGQFRAKRLPCLPRRFGFAGGVCVGRV